MHHRKTPNNTQSLSEYLVTYDCVRTGTTKTDTKHARTPKHAAQIVFELSGCSCKIISVKPKKPR